MFFDDVSWFDELSSSYSCKSACDDRLRLLLRYVARVPGDGVAGLLRPLLELRHGGLLLFAPHTGDDLKNGGVCVCLSVFLSFVREGRG